MTVKNGVAEAVFGKDAARLKASASQRVVPACHSTRSMPLPMQETVAQAAAKGLPAMNFHLDHVVGGAVEQWMPRDA